MNFLDEISKLTFTFAKDIQKVKKKYPQEILPTLGIIKVLIDMDLDTKSAIFHAIRLMDGDQQE